MSASLTTQIRDFYSYVDEQQGAVDMTAVQERRVAEQLARPVQFITSPHRSEWVRPLRTDKPTVQRHRLAVAMVTVVSVLVLLGVVNWLLRLGVEDSPVVTQPPSPILSSSTWSRVPHDERVFGGEGDQSMHSVTVGGPGLVAVGGELLGAAVWTSPDGVTWSRVPHDETVFGGIGNQRMESVTVGGPGLVAVGRVGPEAAVWTSSDAVIWSRVSNVEPRFLGVMKSVTVGGPGLVAVGWFGSAAAAVWTSPDGITWSQVPYDEAAFGGIFGGIPGRTGMVSVTAGGPGLVAVGRADSDAAVWTSVDGLTWTRVPHDETVFGGAGDQSMHGVTVGGPGLVAVGETDSGAAVWTSPDGITWSRVPHDETVFGGAGDQSMHSVTVGGPGLVAVGRADSDAAAVWTSVDGMTWTRVPLDEAVFGGEGDQSMHSVTVGGRGLVAVGGALSISTLPGHLRQPDSDAAVWMAVDED